MPLAPLLRQSMRRFGERLALAEGERRITHAALDEMAERAASALARRCAPGERVLVVAGNSWQAAVAMLAIERAGLVRVMVNRFATRDDVAAYAGAVEPALVLHDEEAGEKIGALAGPCIPFGDGPGRFGAVLTAETGPLPDLDPSAPCSISFTSGSTGAPKGAVLSYAAWAHVARNMLIDRDIRADDVMGHIGPLGHASGAYLAPYLLRGGANAMLPSDAPGALAEAARLGVTTLNCVPTMLRRLVEAAAAGVPSSLRRIVYGAERCPEPTLRAAWARFGPILVQNYGLTEAMMTVCTLSEADHLDAGGALRVGALGRPYSFVEVRRAAASGAPAAPDEPGELLIRSPHLFSGYWRDPAATAAVMHDGWLRSGDLALEEADGVLRLVGRARDIVISGGFNIHPGEVEAWLCALDGVREAACFGVDDDTWGERLVAVVALEDQSMLARVQAWSRERLGIKTPRTWLVRQSLPRTLNGKIDKTALRREAAHG